MKRLLFLLILLFISSLINAAEFLEERIVYAPLPSSNKHENPFGAPSKEPKPVSPCACPPMETGLIESPALTLHLFWDLHSNISAVVNTSVWPFSIMRDNGSGIKWYDYYVFKQIGLISNLNPRLHRPYHRVVPKNLIISTFPVLSDYSKSKEHKPRLESFMSIRSDAMKPMNMTTVKLA